MSVVLDGNPGERVLLYGADGTSLLKVATNASGQLVVVGAGTGGAVEVVQDTPDDLLVGPHGYISAAWKRQPLQFGYGGVVEEDVRIESAAGGTNVLTTTAVPANRVHVVTALSLNNRTTAATTGSIELASDGEFVGVGFPLTLTLADRRYGIQALLVMEAGESLRGIIFGATGGDDLHFNHRGYFFDINL